MAYAIDLFCGAGGMSEGIIQAGFHILFSSDINESVQITYMNRHEQLGFSQGNNTYFHRGDIRELDGEFITNSIASLEIFQGQQIPEIDAIFGGPLCQGFSRAGRRNPNDPRNMLFREYLRVINEVNPKYVVLENVTGFTDTRFYGFIGVTGSIYEDGSLVPEILRKEFELLGYRILEPKILNAAHYGVPQRRNRVIIMAYREDVQPPEYPVPTHTDDNALTITEAISDLIQDEEVNEGINISDKPELVKHVVAKSNYDADDVIKKFRHADVDKKLIDILLTKKNIRTRLDRTKPSATVMTIADDYISPFEPRTFTVRELARIQSFDDSFEFLGKRTTGGLRRRVEVPQYSQVGNAVPPLLVKAVAAQIIKANELNN